MSFSKVLFTSLFILSLSMSMSLGVLADTNDNKAIIYQHYEEFVRLRKEGKTDQAIEAIKKAYLLSDEHFETSKLTANLLYNYASIISKHTDVSSRNKSRITRRILTNTIDKYIQVYGENAIELVDAYMLKANYFLMDSFGRLAAIKYYNKAFKVAKAHNDDYPSLYADISFEAARNLFKIQYEKAKGKAYILRALDIYKKIYEKPTEQIASASLWLAKYYYEAENEKAAISYIQEVVDFHKQTDTEYHPRLIQAYSLLIEIYETLGHKDKAVFYSQEIGRSIPLDDNQEIFPIFMPPLQVSSFSGGLKVTFELSITKEGSVSDAEVISIHGKEEHAKSIKESILHWRFSPKFKDGQAVESTTTFTLDVGDKLDPLWWFPK